jgi:glucose/arabinose dehydrogenase
MLKKLLFFVLLAAPILLVAQPKIQLKQFATGFNRPVDIAHCGDSRLFVVEQAGYIWVVDSLGVKSAQPFLDIRTRVLSSGNEQGLLGLAFHPNYAQNGYFFVYYTKLGGGDTRVARFSRDSLNINKADPNSEKTVLEQTQPFSNHNGGSLKFSPVDSFLYIGLGDGGSANDPNGNGQNTNTFLGKILRIDVTPGAVPYTVPASNPFVNKPGIKPEIWSWGWRNPWRFSFDRSNGGFWIGDVGQNIREEIDYEPAGKGGLNYGWRCYEGIATFNTSGCLGASNYTLPIFDYVHSGGNGCSVTGGFIYRGTKYPDLYGCYLFADYCSGRWWYTRLNADGITGTTNVLANLTAYEYSSLGEDVQGELYVAALSSGKIFKITELCSPFQISGTASAPVCEGTQAGSINLNITGGSGIINIIWSTGATTQNITGLNPGTYIAVATNGNGCIRRDTFVVESASPLAPQVSVLNLGPFCVGDSVLLEASAAPAGYGYQWYNYSTVIDGATTQQYITTTDGIFAAAHTALGCNSEVSTEISVTFNTLPVVSVLGDSVLCAGETAILQAKNVPQGDSIQWFSVASGAVSNGNDHKLSILEGGFYYFETTGPCGVASSDTFHVKAELIILPIVVQSNDTLFANGGFTKYQWLLNGVPILGATTSTYIASETGFYQCAVTAASGCSYVDGLQVVISSVQLPASVDRFQLLPNPTQGNMTLSLDLKKMEHLKYWLLDASNRQIFMQTFQGQNLTKTLELGALPPGNYYLHIQLESGSFVRKIVKQ